MLQKSGTTCGVIHVVLYVELRAVLVIMALRAGYMSWSKISRYQNACVEGCPNLCPVSSHSCEAAGCDMMCLVKGSLVVVTLEHLIILCLGRNWTRVTPGSIQDE